VSPSRLGVIYIGQTPRPNYVAEVRKVLGPSVEIIEAGALDGLSRVEIEALVPRDSKDTLYSRLPSGDDVVVSKIEVTRRVQGLLEDLAGRGLDVILMFCTGAFHGLKPKELVVFPSAVLAGYLEAVVPAGRLGFFTPLPSQVEQVTQKWARPSWAITVVPLVPSATTDREILPAVERMTQAQPDLIVLDCMAYTHAHKERIRELTGVRTVLAVSLAARAVQELIG